MERRSLLCVSILLVGLLLCLSACQHTPQVVWRLDESSTLGKQYVAEIAGDPRLLMDAAGGVLIGLTYIKQAPSDVPGDATIFHCHLWSRLPQLLEFHELAGTPASEPVAIAKEKGLAIQRGDTLHVRCVGSPGTYYLISVSR